MGANGNRAAWNGASFKEGERTWRVVECYRGKLHVLEMADKIGTLKLPRKSESPDVTYVMFKKDGSGIKTISKYNKDCDKEYEIHYQDHCGMNPHGHIWHDGRPDDAIPLTKDMKDKILQIEKIVL